MRTTLAVAIFIAGVASLAARETPRFASVSASDVAGTRASALRAYAEGDFDEYLQNVQRLAFMLPNYPAVSLRLAAAQARVGHKDEALATLAAIADAGISVDLNDDKRNADDFASIAGDPKFEAFRRRVAQNGQPSVRSKMWHRFAEPALLAEDVARNPKDGSYYVSSVLEHKVVRVGADGTESDFPLDEPENGWNVSGVEVDAKRGVLWVSAQALRGFPGIAETDAGRSSISAYGLKSKKRVFKHVLIPEAGHQAAIGDLALTPSGDLLAMDAQGANIYRITADRRSIEALDRPFLSPQDAAVPAKGNLAFVADYQRGIARIDLASGEEEWLGAGPSIALSGIDGLYPYRQGLIAVQNGVQPKRIAYLTLDAERRNVTRLDVLERGAPLGEVTHGVIVGDTFVYIANSGWDKLDEHGVVREGETLSAPELRKLDLTVSVSGIASIANGVWLLPGSFTPGTQPDGNSVLFDAPAGLVVMDTGRHADHTDKLIDFAHSRRERVAAIVNSHWHLDHVGGNPALRAAFPGVKVYASGAIDGALKGFLADYRGQLEQLLERATPEKAQDFRDEIARIDAGPALRPTRVVTGTSRHSIAGRDFTVGLERRAATEADVWLLDTRTRTLVSGDLVTLPVPFMDTACPSGWEAALDHLAKLDFTLLIPGHGAPMKRQSFETYRTAFGKLVACAASPRDKASCIDDWIADAGSLIASDDVTRARAMLEYYMDTRLRGDQAKSACTA